MNRNKLLLFVWVLAIFSSVQMAEASTTTYNIVEQQFKSYGNL